MSLLKRTHSQIRRISLSTLEQLWFGPPQVVHAPQLVQLETSDCKCHWTNLKYILFICASFIHFSDPVTWVDTVRQAGIILPQTHDRRSAQWGKGGKNKTGFWTPVLPPQCSGAKWRHYTSLNAIFFPTTRSLLEWAAERVQELEVSLCVWLKVITHLKTSKQSVWFHQTALHLNHYWWWQERRRWDIIVMMQEM